MNLTLQEYLSLSLHLFFQSDLTDYHIGILKFQQIPDDLLHHQCLKNYNLYQLIGLSILILRWNSFQTLFFFLALSQLLDWLEEQKFLVYSTHFSQSQQQYIEAKQKNYFQNKGR